MESPCDRRQTEVQIASLRSVQMGAQNHFSAFINRVVDGGKSAANASVVCDVTGLIQRHVEVGANDDALALEGKILDRDFIKVHASRLMLSPETS